MRSSSTKAIEVIPTGAAAGAEVHGIDLSRDLSDETAGLMRAAWGEHLVLLFRGQNLTPGQYVNAASVFGEPQVGAARAYYRNAGAGDDMHALPVPEISVLSNLDADGNPVRENSGLGSVEVVWHSDNSYIDKPPAGSILYAREIPNDGTGKTSFANQYLAYEQLSNELKNAVEGRCSKQDASRNSAGVLRPGLSKPEQPEDVPGPMHPLVRRHPVTGKHALYLGRRRAYPSQYVPGLSSIDSETLLDTLWAQATRQALTWQHTWRVGDVLVWDNRCLLHYRESVNHRQRRVMWRSQFEGESVLPGGVARERS
jgi:taurine dioxygenase